MADKVQVTIYLDEDGPEQWGRVKAYYTAKNDGRPVSDSAVGRSLVREKDADVTNERTRSLTLARVYAEMQSLALLNDERYQGLLQALDRLAVALERFPNVR